MQYAIWGFVFLITIFIPLYISNKNIKTLAQEELSAIISCLNIILESDEHVIINKITIKLDKKVLWQNDDDYILTKGVIMRKFNVKVNNNLYNVEVEEIFDELSKYKCELTPTEIQPIDIDIDSKTITAPFKGSITDIKVSANEKACKGDVILVIEAMKMENEIKAIEDCEISCVCVKIGDVVETGEILIAYK